LSSRAKEEFKLDREEEFDPAVLPEVKPYTRGCTALSVVKGLVTESILSVNIRGENFEFMVDTGVMVPVVQPGVSEARVQTCDVRARGVTGTRLEILGEQEI
jgi:hypothetical protein